MEVHLHAGGAPEWRGRRSRSGGRRALLRAGWRARAVWPDRIRAADADSGRSPTANDVYIHDLRNATKRVMVVCVESETAGTRLTSCTGSRSAPDLTPTSCSRPAVSRRTSSKPICIAGSPAIRAPMPKLAITDLTVSPLRPPGGNGAISHAKRPGARSSARSPWQGCSVARRPSAPSSSPARVECPECTSAIPVKRRCPQCTAQLAST